MSEREKEIMENFTKAISKMDDFEKGRFLGRAEGMAEAKDLLNEKESVVAS